ncbi:MAG: Transposase family [Gemmataceae bacterium]|nr:Transposase family [Gemmataceae bacterium]
MDDPRDRRIAELEAENAELRRRIAQLEHQLQTVLQRRKRRPNKGTPRQGTPADRRRQEHRTHPGVFRPEPPPGTTFTEHDVHPKQCTHCGSGELEPTARCDDHIVADIPEPKLEWHRYRRHVYRCRTGARTGQGRGDLELPGAHIGPRARLLTGYSRAHLGISLGKTRDLLHDFFGLTVSRAGLLGHLRWGGTLFEPVVEELLDRLRKSPVVQGDETGWRINGQTAWAWCFRDPKLALFLIDRHRSRDVIVRVLGESFAGTLVSDFYAAYNGLDCPKQRCLVHLLRELAKLRDELPGPSVRAFIQPLLTLFQDALQLGKDREPLTREAFGRARQAIRDRSDDLLLNSHTRHPDCLRIWRRLAKHSDELFTSLDDPRVPADNNGSERDIRGLAAARNDGGTHRAEWRAAAFARIKSVIVTSLKNGLRFIHYGLEVVSAKLQGQPLPLPVVETA